MTVKKFDMGAVLREMRLDWIIILLLMAEFIAGFILYPHLPERVPSHWNIHGQVDRYSSNFWGAFGLPLLTLGMYVMMLVLPQLDPKRGNYLRFAGAYRILKLILALFFAVLYAVVILAALGYAVPVDRFVITGIGILFMVIGNFMGQFRHNYFVGIKTPWTLASETVWQKTHRLGSKLWVLAGLLVVMIGLTIGGEKGFLLFFAILGLAAVVPMVYSYLLYNRIKA